MFIAGGKKTSKKIDKCITSTCLPPCFPYPLLSSSKLNIHSSTQVFSVSAKTKKFNVYTHAQGFLFIKHGLFVVYIEGSGVETR